MRLYWDNFIDAAATVITSNTEQTDLPDDNVAHAHKEKIYRTTGAGTTEWIKFDLGSAKDVDGFVLFNHNLDNTETAVNIEANASDSWGSPSLSQAITVNATDPAFHYWSSPQNYQWWRFEFTKAAAGTLRDIGRMFLGDVYTLTEDPDHGGYSDDRMDPSTSNRSRGGQTFHDILPQYDRISTSFTKIGLTQANQLKTIFQTIGIHTPFFMQVDEDASDSVREVMHYVKYTRGLKRNVTGFDSELKMDLNLEFETQL